MPLLLMLLGVGAVAVPLLGPLGFGVLDYHVSDGATDQVRGGDVAGLALVAPLAFLAAWLLRRGHGAGPALALAPASYGLYVYTQLAISGDLLRYAGNSERYFGLFWALITVCGAVLVLAGARLATSPAGPPTYRRRLTKVSGWYLLGVAVFLAVGLHLPGLVDAWRASPTSEEYLADPGVFWVVKVMDLAYVLPVVVGVGVGLLRGRPWAATLLAPVTGWCALLAGSVAGMGLTMLATDAPGASVGLAVGFVLAAVIALALAVAAFLPLFRRSPAPSPARRTSASIP